MPTDYDKLAAQYGGGAGDAGSPDKYDQLAQQHGAKVAAAANTPGPRKWTDVPGEALGNIPQSAANFVGGIYQAVRHPLDTAGNLLDVGAGALQNLMPSPVKSAIDRIDPNPQSAQRAVQAADATGQFFKDRYGSVDGLKKTIATDPVGLAADASVLLSGGATLAGKVGMAGASGALRAAGEAANPIGAVAKVVPKIGNGAANLIGGLGTHTGAETIKQAFRSGAQGGASAKAFSDNLRGNVPMTDVLDAAKANIEAMGRAKSAAYRQGMAGITSDKTVLDFNGIDKAVADAAKAVTFKGQVKNTKAAQVQQAIADEIANWKALDPAEYHTPEGLDALKQKIGGIVESVPFEEKTARMVGNKIYHAVKGEIVQQAPVYADTMKAYSEATDQIREIERALSLGGKASVDTAMRKLQSLTRNNVNTNYGNRLRLAQEMEQAGGREIMPALAGQALSSWTPRGFGGAVAGGLGYGGYMAGGMPGALATLAVQSPRLMGEAAFGAGRAAGGLQRGAQVPLSLLDQVGVAPLDLMNGLYQAGRLPQ
jgi:hypothetical protein